MSEEKESSTADLPAPAGGMSAWRYAIFETTIEAIIIIDAWGKIVQYNPAAEELFGFKREEVIGATMADLIVPEAFRAHHAEGLRRYRETGQDRILGKRLELPAIRADGEEIPVELTVSRVKGPGPVLFAGYVRDLTQRRKAEEALRLTQFTVDRAAYAVFWITQDGRIAYVNDLACQWLGYARAELLEMHVRDISPELPDETWEAHWDRLAREGSLNFETVNFRKDGSSFPVQIAANYLEFQGKAYNCKIAIDISERKRSEQALRDSEQKLRAIMDAVLDAVVMADPEGRVAHWNPAAEQMFGYTFEEIRHKSIHDILTPERYRAQANRAWDMFAGDGSGEILGTTRELAALRKDGTEFPIELSISSIQLDNRWWAVGVLRDITERKRIEQQLKQALNEAQVANRAKTEFLALISHEMRTPLNGILGTISLLNDTPLVGEQVEFVDNCRQAARQLADLINDLLDFSQIEAGKLELRESPFRLRDQIGSLASTFARAAREKRLGFRYDLDDRIPDVVVGDGGRLRQVLENLLSNAIKFTGTGFVGLSVHLLAADGNEIRLGFTVTDTGIGIAPHDRQRIFNRFEQVDASSTRRFGGVGLGLAICSQLVTMMGGQITVTDGPSGGTKFDFSAVFRRIADGAIQRSTGLGVGHMRDYMQALGRPLRVLVAEDDELSRKLAERMLSRVGCEVITAIDGADAVEKYQTRADEIDIILMDMMMPMMGGKEATREIRHFDAPRGRRVPIVALTAQAMKGDRERCLAADMDGFVAKPVDRDQLFETMLTLLPEAVEAEAAENPPATEDAAAAHVDTFDRAALLARCDQDAEFLAEIVALFLDNSDELLSDIADAVERKDRDLLVAHAHRLKGSISNMCAQRGFQAAQELERQARDASVGWNAIGEQLAILRNELLRLRETLASS